MAVIQSWVLFVMVGRLLAGTCPDDPDLDICDVATTTTLTPSQGTGGEGSTGGDRSTGDVDAAFNGGLSKLVALVTLWRIAPGGGSSQILMTLAMAHVALISGAMGQTCSAVADAYKAAGCCGASDRDTRTVEVGPIMRPGCNSRVAQSSTTGKIVGGTLYVYDPTSSEKTWKTFADGKTYVDLADSSIAAGCVPKHKPHMVLPSPDGKYTAVTYTGDQDFAILKNDEYKVVFCPTVDFLKPHVFGGATHSGAWYGSEYFLLLDMTGCVNGVCGGGVYRFLMNYDNAGVMTGYKFETPLGVEGVKEARNTSATKPIALGNNPHGQYAHLFFVSDAKGAGSIMDAKTMTWVKHFKKAEFGNCFAGGLWVEPHPTDPKIVLVQYGQQGTANAPGANCIFKVDMSSRSLSKMVQLKDNTDAHGLQFCTTTDGQLNVLNTNRQTSTLDVVKYADSSIALDGYDLNAKVFDAMTADFAKDPETVNSTNTEVLQQDKTKKLQPDVVKMHGDFLYMAARGPKPVSAVKAQNYYENGRPGMMAVKIDKTTCQPAADQSEAMILTCLERSPEITSDVHSLWTVKNGDKTEIWAVDQAGTGSVQTYSVYSACSEIGATSEHKDPAVAPTSGR